MALRLENVDFEAAGNMTLSDLFSLRLAETPDALVIRSVLGDMTFSEWHARAVAFRAVFEDQFEDLHGKRIALWMSSDEACNYVSAMQAVYEAGAIVVPLDDRMAVEEARRIFADVEPCLLAMSRIVAERLGSEGFAALGVDSPELPMQPGVEAFILRVEGDKGSGDPMPWAPGQVAVAVRPSPARPGDNAFMAFTSGTTGRPKAAMWTQATICQYAERVAHAVYSEPRGGRNLGRDDVLQSPIPVYTGASMFENVYPAVFSGCTLVFEGRRFDPKASLQRMARFGTTVFNAVPPHLAMMCAEEPVTGASPQIILTSGSAITSDLYHRVRKRWPDTTVVNWYGLNESGTGQLINFGTDMDRNPQSIGRAVWPTEIKVVDAEGEEVASGAEGELWMRAPGQLTEYFRQPDKTAEMLHNGWLKTGDRVYMDEDGLVHVVGRGGDRINRGGFKFYPAEVESALERHPAVRKASILAIPHPILGQDTVAFVELLEEADEKSLRDFCKSEVAANKVPARIFKIDHLPLVAYGKVHKGQLMERYKEIVNSESS